MSGNRRRAVAVCVRLRLPRKCVASKEEEENKGDTVKRGGGNRGTPPFAFKHQRKEEKGS